MSSLEKLKKQANKLPNRPGIYQFLGESGAVLYIGKAKNLRNRVKSYFTTGLKLGNKTATLLAKTKSLKTIFVESEIEALLLEAALIKKFQPKYNAALKDDKSHLYIKITTGDEIPLITTARRETEKRGVKLFGPFPSAATVRSVLRILRPIFPYCTTSHGGKVKRKCLYCHLGLCPYPFESDEKKTEYKKTVKGIIMFLEGKKAQLILALEKKMKAFAKNLEFEMAAKIKKQIEDLKYITTSVISPEEYLRRPDLVEDLALESVTKLAKILDLDKIPHRIECYDISNILGAAATGSLVVFENGMPAKNWYRRFKIRTKAKPDDVAMMKEVLLRRFGNDWPHPDLIIVDGGKGQLRAVGQVLTKLKLTIPFLALAKKEEEIYLPGKKTSIKLGRDSQALQLIQHLRDESHRFAITYHRKLRSLAFLA